MALISSINQSRVGVLTDRPKLLQEAKIDVVVDVVLLHNGLRHS